MTEQEKETAARRIYDVALKLFARKGYSAVGVREIARAADVNIAMISYYFGGKGGILKKIFKNFFEQYFLIFNESGFEDKSVEEGVKDIIRTLVKFVSRNRELTLVTFFEMPFDDPELIQYKANLINELVGRVDKIFVKWNINPENRRLLSMLGPSLLASITMNFKLREVITRVYEIEDAEGYDNDLAKVMGSLIYGGLREVIEKYGDIIES